MKFLSVCSGIEAASVAWTPLGFECVAVAEIEPFTSAVLQHHYPNIPNLGDITNFQSWKDMNFEILIGGTPCQAFSVAGLQRGLSDPRGNLAITYLEILNRYKPEWFIWENVPGVLSSNKGRDFSSFIGGVAKFGYQFGWRILDAQHVRTRNFPKAVPQRRRRVFVVGHLGSWECIKQVLFEPRRSQKVINFKQSTQKKEDKLVASICHQRSKDVLAFQLSGWNSSVGQVSPTLDVVKSGKTAIYMNSQVRRLTPRECERLQGFPDDYTLVPYKNKLAPDTLRYKALGNSMSVNVIQYLGEQIQAVHYNV